MNRFIIVIIFDFLKKEEIRSGTHFSQQTCFFLLCQFFFPAGNRFWFYILLRYLEYHVVLCSFFWFWQETVFGVTYVLKCTIQLCGGKVNFVQIFLLNPNFLLVHGVSQPGGAVRLPSPTRINLEEP